MEEGIQSPSKEKKVVMQSLSILFLTLSLLVGVTIVSQLREYRFIGQNIPPQKTITVSGKGEVVAVPDIATLSVTVDIEKSTVIDAQNEATERINEIVSYLEDQDIDEKDVKTTSYNIYPQYDYTQVNCLRFPCPPREEVLRGYRVSQTLQIKVRDIDIVGKILGGIGELGATNVFGPNFDVDDRDALVLEARDMAIKDAKDKAKKLAKELGVELIGVVSYSDGGFPIYRSYDSALGFGGSVAESVQAPKIPFGENEIVSNVSITYQIR